MLEIYPISYVSLKNDVRGLESKYQSIWDEIVNRGGEITPNKSLFLQVGYNEIAGEELDRILGYRGIAQANKPIGLPCEFDAFSWARSTGSETLLFPLSGLYSHFREVAPVIFNEFGTYGSMDAYVDFKGDEMTAVEYLVAGSLECIAFCNRNRFGLALHW